MKNSKITVLKSIIYDTTRLQTTNNKVSVAKLIYIYLFNLRLANNKKLPTKRKIAQNLNIDYRSVQQNLNLLISAGFLSVENETYEIYYENQTTKELTKIDETYLFSKEGNKKNNFYSNYCGYYIKAPQSIIFSDKLSANEKIYYLIFLDYFMKNGSLTNCYYPICHLSKLINDKTLARKTVYENFSKLREKGFIKCDLINYGHKANEKGFKKLTFFEKAENEPEQQIEYFEEIEKEECKIDEDELLKLAMMC